MKSKVAPIQIYAKLSEDGKEAVFSKITLVDFVECFSSSIDNILLLKSDYVGRKHFRNFELLEGKEDITNFALEGTYSCGDFCFVDYASPSSLNKLTEEQIAELLYLAHLQKPLKSSFFEVLQNKFVYLAHDNGWYCKLYCQESQYAISLLFSKMQKSLQKIHRDEMIVLSDDVIETISKLAKKGLIIEIDSVTINTKNNCKDKCAIIKLYDVGDYDDMDTLYSDLNDSKHQVFAEKQLLPTRMTRQRKASS